MVLLLVYLYLLSGVCVAVQNSIGLRASSYLRGINFGTAVRVNYLRQNVDNGEYNANVQNNYNLIVPENEMKPQHIWLGDNVYDFTDADFLLGSTPNTTGWIQRNLMQIRGHNLVWAQDSYVPIWLLNHESSITPDKARQLLSDYVHTVVSRYRGKTLCWDVVNEVIDDNNNTNPFNLRNGFWFRKLGPDYIKYAFQFAHEADPNVQLYYNEYGIEKAGLKTTRVINLVKWLRSEGMTVHGIGLQWHIYIPTNVSPGDVHYQSAQQIVDNNLDFMITELDIWIFTNGGLPKDPNDLGRQAYVYGALLEYALYFAPNCKAMLTWGLTDRYSWIPVAHKYTVGAALPLDWLYQPKRAYWRMEEVMTRIINDGIYRLSPQSYPDKCLGLSQNTSSNQLQIYNDSCNNAYEKWNITWQGDGTYRFSSLADNNRVLAAYNTTATVGGVETMIWSNDVNQEWAFSSQGNNTYRVVPRTAWWRMMALYGSTDQIRIVDRNATLNEHWILNSF